MVQQKFWNLVGDGECLWKVQQECKIKFSCSSLVDALEENLLFIRHFFRKFNFSKRKGLVL